MRFRKDKHPSRRNLHIKFFLAKNKEVYTRNCFFILLVLISLKLEAQIDLNDVSYLKKNVYFLASDSLHGRPAGSQFEQMSAKFIAKELKKEHIKPFSDSYNHTFSYLKDDSIEVNATNVIAQTHNPQKINIIISAHYDHLEEGAIKSREVLNKNQIHNGADDNASGVALVLLLAKQLKCQKKELPFNVIFAFYSGHEDGLHGSQSFMQECELQGVKIDWVLNFDMIGRLDEQNPILGIQAFNLSNDYKAKLEELKNQTKLEVRISHDSERKSDDYHFREAGCKTLSFTTGTHADYHKSTDDADKVNFEGIIRIEEYVLQIIENLSLLPE